MINKKFLITGGSGFIGTNLIDYLLLQNMEILNIDIKSPKKKAHLEYWVNLDINNKNLLSTEVKKFNPDFIFHLAARTDLNGKSLEDYKTNYKGVENIITSAKGLNNLNVIVFASSRLVCKIGYVPSGDNDYIPTTYYGESKVLAEKIIKKSSTSMKYNWIIVRPTSIWGPWFSTPYYDFFLTIYKGRYFHPSRQKILKSFGFVGNTVFQLFKISENSKILNRKVIYLCDNEPIILNEMANQIGKVFKKNKIYTIPFFVLKIAAYVGDFIKILGYKNPPLTTFRLRNISQNMIYDNRPLKNIYPKLPYTLNDGINLTCKWMKFIKK